MRFFLFVCFAVSLALPAAGSRAQDTIPDLPQALQNMEARGAQMRYLGKTNGFDGWISIYQGQEQYFYVPENGQGFVMGVLFDAEGNMVTLKQVSDLQKQSGDVLDILAADRTPEEVLNADRSSLAQIAADAAPKSPAERMFADVENSNWVRLGNANAPVIYSFIDPQCPHCHDFLLDLEENYIDAGLIQVRAVPVGFSEQSMAQAAFLLASPDPEERLFNHLHDDQSALPAKSDVSTQGVQANMAVMQAWKFNVTPMTVYKNKDGEIKIVRGRAKDISALIADLDARSAAAGAS